VHISLSRPNTPPLIWPNPFLPTPFSVPASDFNSTREWPSVIDWTLLFVIHDYNLNFFAFFGAKNSIRLRVSLKTQSALLRRPRVHVWILSNQNTSNKIENFDKTVLASGDVSILRKNKRTSSFNFTPIGYSQLTKKGEKCADMIRKKSDWKKKTWKKRYYRFTHHQKVTEKFLWH